MAEDGPRVVDIGVKDMGQAELDKLKRALPRMQEVTEIVAELRRHSYEAHIKQGFTDEQALELCQKPFQ